MRNLENEAKLEVWKETGVTPRQGIRSIRFSLKVVIIINNGKQSAFNACQLNPAQAQLQG